MTSPVRWEGMPQVCEWLAAYVPGHTTAQCAEAVNERFGLGVSPSQVANFKQRRGLRSGVHVGFERGHVPANKGRRWGEYMPPESQQRCRSAQFRPGNYPANAASRPVGYERTSKDGYVEVKVSEEPRRGSCFRPKSSVVWEEANGRSVPPGHRVIFCDGDTRNFDPSNLLCVSGAELALMNHGGPRWADRQSAESALALARLRLAIGRAERAPRECARCGATFTPEYRSQRTCRACLGPARRSGGRR